MPPQTLPRSSPTAATCTRSRTGKGATVLRAIRNRRLTLARSPQAHRLRLPLCRSSISARGLPLCRSSIIARDLPLALTSRRASVRSDDPGTSYFSHLSQDKATGELRLKSTMAMDWSKYEGLWVPCAGSVSPWKSHLGSEEYEQDSRPLAEYAAMSPDGAEWKDERIATWATLYMGLPDDTTNAEFQDLVHVYYYGAPAVHLRSALSPLPLLARQARSSPKRVRRRFGLTLLIAWRAQATLGKSKSLPRGRSQSRSSTSRWAAAARSSSTLCLTGRPRTLSAAYLSIFSSTSRLARQPLSVPSLPSHAE